LKICPRSMTSTTVSLTTRAALGERRMRSAARTSPRLPRLKSFAAESALIVKMGPADYGRPAREELLEIS
jgi:hypothetical protein